MYQPGLQLYQMNIGDLVEDIDSGRVGVITDVGGDDLTVAWAGPIKAIKETSMIKASNVELLGRTKPGDRVQRGDDRGTIVSILGEQTVVLWDDTRQPEIVPSSSLEKTFNAPVTVNLKRLPPRKQIPVITFYPRLPSYRITATGKMRRVEVTDDEIFVDDQMDLDEDVITVIDVARLPELDQADIERVILMGVRSGLSLTAWRELSESSRAWNQASKSNAVWDAMLRRDYKFVSGDYHKAEIDWHTGKKRRNPDTLSKRTYEYIRRTENAWDSQDDYQVYDLQKKRRVRVVSVFESGNYRYVMYVSKSNSLLAGIEVYYRRRALTLYRRYGLGGYKFLSQAGHNETTVLLAFVKNSVLGFRVVDSLLDNSTISELTNAGPYITGSVPTFHFVFDKFFVVELSGSVYAVYADKPLRVRRFRGVAITANTKRRINLTNMMYVGRKGRGICFRLDNLVVCYENVKWTEIQGETPERVLSTDGRIRLYGVDKDTQKLSVMGSHAKIEIPRNSTILQWFNVLMVYIPPQYSSDSGVLRVINHDTAEPVFIDHGEFPFSKKVQLKLFGPFFDGSLHIVAPDKSEYIIRPAKPVLSLVSCHVCDNVAKWTCEQCKNQQYCGVECQALDWKTHKKYCK